MFKSIVLILIGALIVAAVVFGVISTTLVGTTNLQEEGLLELSAVASRSDYNVGDPIEIRLTLTNTGRIPTGASPLVDGNVRVHAFRRDGADVSSRRTQVDYFIALADQLRDSLRTLAPGASLETNWRSEPDAVLGGAALASVAFDPDGAHWMTLYALDAPGDYELILSYQYPGPPGALPQVFRAGTNQVTVRFAVRP